MCKYFEKDNLKPTFIQDLLVYKTREGSTKINLKTTTTSATPSTSTMTTTPTSSTTTTRTSTTVSTIAITEYKGTFVQTNT